MGKEEKWFVHNSGDSLVVRWVERFRFAYGSHSLFFLAIPSCLESKGARRMWQQKRETYNELSYTDMVKSGTVIDSPLVSGFPEIL